MKHLSSSSQDPVSDLKLLVRSHHGLICIATEDERRTRAILAYCADLLHLPFIEWTATKGLIRKKEKGSVYNSKKIFDALDHIEASAHPAIYYFHGIGHYLQDVVVQQKIKDVGRLYESINGTIFFTGTDEDLPPRVKSSTALYDLPHPSETDYKNLVMRIVRDLKKKIPLRVSMDKKSADSLIKNMRGLTLMEAEKILTRVLVEKNALGADAVKQVVKAKAATIQKEGLLEYYPVESVSAKVAGLKGLKLWLKKRTEIINNPKHAREFGLIFPKGVLLLGVQGCGKSLCAKSVAAEWGLPLLKFDPSNLYNKFMGESEKNFKRAVKMAEKMAPVVLWIDEIEKAFSQGSGTEDGGVSTRILGTFLSWLQDRQGDVFVIATANSIDKLPPEFLRKGRFDEIFFVDLPNKEARCDIFVIHLEKRKRDPMKFHLSQLVEMTKGFSGSEIEQVVVSGLYTAFSRKTKLSTEILKQEIQLTRPLSQTMKEKIDALRAWAKTRTVSAQ